MVPGTRTYRIITYILTVQMLKPMMAAFYFRKALEANERDAGRITGHWPELLPD